jgi:hypothetical protein
MDKFANQLRFAQNNHVVSHHAFLSKLANGVKEAIEQGVPELKLRVGGKSTSGNNIQIEIVGNVETENDDAMKRIDDLVRQTIDSLKNPANLMSTIK